MLLVLYNLLYDMWYRDSATSYLKMESVPCKTSEKAIKPLTYIMNHNKIPCR